MGIGTSLGAYFNDDFDHHAGIQQPPPEVLKPPDTGDDNVNPPEDKYTKPYFIDVADKPDYDYDAWRKANPETEMKPGQHYPDTYKLPNHMTFSDESIYHGQDGNEGGQWGKDGDKWTFTPGKTNLENHSMDELESYFKRVEPDSILLPPTASTMASGASRKAQDALERAKATSPTSDVDTGLEGHVYLKTPHGSITDKDLDVGTGLALSFSGGGLTENVKSAALQYKGKTYEGANHGYALGDIMDLHGSNINMKDIKDGFVTSNGRFISREEAFDLAKKNEQIEPKVLQSIPKDQEGNMLLSEDLKGSRYSPYTTSNRKNPIDLDRVAKDKAAIEEALSKLIPIK